MDPGSVTDGEGSHTSNDTTDEDLDGIEVCVDLNAQGGRQD